MTTTVTGSLRNIVVQADGKILIGGNLTAINGTARSRIARLNADFSLDTTFSPGTGFNSTVWIINLLASGKMIVGGLFTTFNSVSRSGIAQLNADGSLDTTFIPGTGFRNGTAVGTVYAIKVLGDGSIGVGGFFTQYNGVNRDIAAILTPTGSLSPDFSLSTLFQANIRTVVRQFGNNGQKVLIGGTFNRVNGSVVSGNIARLNLDGTLDSSFNVGGAGANGLIYVMKQRNDKIMIAGEFTTYNGVSRNRIARLNEDGTIDITFNPGTGASAFVSNIERNYITGSFTSYNGTSRPGIAKLNDNGTLDTTFNPSTVPEGSFFEGIVTTQNGGVVAGGSFTFGGYNSLVRLNPNGSIDNTFTPATEPNTGIFSMALNYTFAEPKILIGGTFTTVGGVTQNGIARLNSNGTRDTTFNVGTGTSVGDDVEDIETRPSASGPDKILIGGLINSVNGVPKSNIARLNNDGSPDTSFVATADNLVWDIESFEGSDEDRSLYIGGDFFAVNNVPRTGVVRLIIEPIETRVPFDFDGDGKTDLSIFRPGPGEWWWNKSSNGGNAALQFGTSTDKITPADYTGDGKTDVAFWRPSSGQWFILRSEDSSFFAFPFGANGDVPVPADYDGDGKADAAVFRPSSNTWFILRSGGGTTITGFGIAGDLPVVADYDGDGKADIAIFRPNAVGGAQWWVQRSSTLQVFATQFGASTDKTVVGDYTGDGKADIAFWRPSTGFWNILRSEDFSFFAFPFGANGDVPSPGDYDGDGKFDATVFRPSNSTWFANRSSSTVLIQQFGITGDLPIPNAYVR